MKTKPVEWIKALRSGKYAQGVRKLVRCTDGVDEFCCLGVKAQLEAPEKRAGWKHESWLVSHIFPEGLGLQGSLGGFYIVKDKIKWPDSIGDQEWPFCAVSGLGSSSRIFT